MADCKGNSGMNAGKHYNKRVMTTSKWECSVVTVLALAENKNLLAQPNGGFAYHALVCTLFALTVCLGFREVVVCCVSSLSCCVCAWSA